LFDLDSYTGQQTCTVETPCQGMYMRRTRNGIPVIWLHYSADPTMTEDRVAELRKKYTSDAMWRQEMEIEYDATTGAKVYDDFSEAKHVIPHHKIPKRLCRYRFIDPHPRTPHAFLWIGVDRYNDLYAYREWWPSIAYGESTVVKDNDKERRLTIKDYVETVALVEGNRIEWINEQRTDLLGTYRRNPGGENIIDCYMDQAGKSWSVNDESSVEERLAERYENYGLISSDPDKRHKVGEDAVHELLRDRHHDIFGNWPRLHLSDRLIESIYEFKKYRYQQTRRLNTEKELKQEGVEARCHMLDLFRYAATADNIRWIPGKESEESNAIERLSRR
jgi:hypothetical protein